MRVLVVEDERKSASFIRKALLAEGFAVDLARDGNDALTAILSTPFDAVVLDIMLPGLDGLAVLRRVRERRCQVPVLLLSARGLVDDRVQGLNAGADDYMAKPFALAELVARVRALCRRSTGSGTVVLTLADLVLDTVSHRATRAGKSIDLSPREYAVLEHLLSHQGRVCSRMQIIEAVWGYDFDPGTNLVDVYIRRIRDKVDGNSANPLVQTVRGVGYVLQQSP